MLIVEDDADFARTVLEIARERGFKGLVALRGDTGLALAREFRPDAIVLDMTPAGARRLDGARPAQAPPGDAAHPGAHRLGRRGAAAGAAGRRGRVPREAGVDARRSTRRLRRDRDVHRPRRPRLLVVDDDEAQRDAIVELVGGDGDVEIVAVGSTRGGARRARREPPFDCMVLDLKLPKMTGFDLLEKVKSDERFARPAGDRLHRARS